MNKGQIQAVIQWIKDVQRDTIDINTSNELEFVLRYLEAMEGERDVV